MAQKSQIDDAVYLLRQGRTDESWEIVSQIHREGGRENFEYAASLCKSSDPIERRVGADILGQLGCTGDAPLLASDSVPILSALLKDSDDRVLDGAIISLMHLKADQVLIDNLALITHVSPNVRYAMAVALGGVKAEEARLALLRLMRDDNDDVRNWATFGIGTQSDSDTMEIRVALLERSRDSHDETRNEAILGLARRRAREVLPALISELEREQPYELAVESAIEFGCAELIPLLERIAEKYGDESGFIREGVEQLRKAGFSQNRT